jgi:glycosyltransferase involved in cell wall biosynthesis
VRRLLGSGELLVTLGPALRSDIEWAVPEKRIAFLPNAVAEHPISCGTDPRSAVLYFSNLIPEKGADVFVQSAIELASRMPEMKFVLAGATADKAFVDSLRSTIASTPVNDRFVFIGPVTDVNQKWKLLTEACVLAFPSTYPFEAQPLTILEALSVGTPVVAFDVGGIRDVIRDGVDGYLVAPGDCAAFEEALQKVLTGGHQRAGSVRLVTTGFETRFSFERYAQSWSQLLKPDAGIVNCDE